VALFPTIVLFTIVGEESSAMCTPPPNPALLPVIKVLAIVGEEPLRYTPPPELAALLPGNTSAICNGLLGQRR
jgi:hypothetical protein